MKVKSESEVAQSCPTLLNPMDCSLPGSSIHGIFQARVLELVLKNLPAKESDSTGHLSTVFSRSFPFLDENVHAIFKREDDVLACF